MKRTLFLVSLCLCSFLTWGQSAKSLIQFVDAQGNAISDGSIVEINQVKIVSSEEEGDRKMIQPNIFIKYLGKETSGIALKLNLESMPNGEFSCCFGSCKDPFDEADHYQSAVAEAKVNELIPLNSEWFLGEDSPEVSWNATLTAGLCSSSQDQWGFRQYTYAEDGPSITIRFVYSTTGISNIPFWETPNKIVARYNTLGQRIMQSCKGLNLIRLSNNKTIKVFIP